MTYLLKRSCSGLLADSVANPSFRTGEAWRNLLRPVKISHFVRNDREIKTSLRVAAGDAAIHKSRLDCFALRLAMTMVACATLAFAAPASAQTPGQYCATVSGCEILDASGGGGHGNTSNFTPVLLKYCKNGKLNITVAAAYAPHQNIQNLYLKKPGGSIYLAQNEASTADPLNDDDCVNLP